MTIDLAPIFTSSPVEFAVANDAANALGLQAMNRAFAESHRLLVLDWQHPSWWFRPYHHALTDTADRPVGVFRG
ncbi:hypothetical protein GCM10012278_52030 [Nonomuraea glycinis]|uniref:Uncharacterized protein n=1 Tax=Nonomuraea glycinis TaxID=2047744 RepID=A0A918A8X3_9ACTN|nr:hypothetical protein GCM10012278_52030 [Nonomuraea glycinis]